MKIGYLLNFWSWSRKEHSILTKFIFWSKKGFFCIVGIYQRDQRDIGVYGGPFKSSVRVGLRGDYLLSWSTYGPKGKSQRHTNPMISGGRGIYPPIPTIDVSEVALRRVNQKVPALARIARILPFKKRHIILKSFIESQFSYCPLIWMFCSRTLNRKISFQWFIN